MKENGLIITAMDMGYKFGRMELNMKYLYKI